MPQVRPHPRRRRPVVRPGPLVFPAVKNSIIEKGHAAQTIETIGRQIDHVRAQGATITEAAETVAKAVAATMERRAKTDAERVTCHAAAVAMVEIWHDFHTWTPRD